MISHIWNFLKRSKVKRTGSRAWEVGEMSENTYICLIMFSWKYKSLNFRRFCLNLQSKFCNTKKSTQKQNSTDNSPWHPELLPLMTVPEILASSLRWLLLLDSLDNPDSFLWNLNHRLAILLSTPSPRWLAQSLLPDSSSFSLAFIPLLLFYLYLTSLCISFLARELIWYFTISAMF